MIKKVYLVVLMFLAIGLLTAEASAQQPTPTPYVRTASENASIEKAIEAARRDGNARVIVVFDEPFIPNSPVYEARVTMLQNELLELLVPYRFTLRHRYTVIPGMALEADEMALMVIRDTPRVRYFELDGVVFGTEPPIKPKTKRMRVF
jgi:hypothetical protein